MDGDSGYISHLRGHCLSFAKHCHLVGTVAECSKGHSTILSFQLLKDDEEDVKKSKFCEHEYSTTLHLIRCNAVWNTMMVDKAFCKSRDGSLGRKGPQIHIYSKCLFQ